MADSEVQKAGETPESSAEEAVAAAQPAPEEPAPAQDAAPAPEAKRTAAGSASLWCHSGRSPAGDGYKPVPVIPGAPSGWSPLTQ